MRIFTALILATAAICANAEKPLDLSLPKWWSPPKPLTVSALAGVQGPTVAVFAGDTANNAESSRECAYFSVLLGAKSEHGPTNKPVNQDHDYLGLKVYFSEKFLGACWSGEYGRMNHNSWNGRAVNLNLNAEWRLINFSALPAGSGFDFVISDVYLKEYVVPGRGKIKGRMGTAPGMRLQIGPVATRHLGLPGKVGFTNMVEIINRSF